MLKPYYQNELVKIYNADCREVLPELDSVDLVLADPPYNVGKDYGDYNDSLPEEEYFNLMGEIVSLCREKAENQAWVSPRHKLKLWLDLIPDCHIIIVRRGAQGPIRSGWSDQYGVVLTVGKPKKAVRDLWDDIRLKGEGYLFREETYGHEGYTPYPIMERCVKLLSSESVIDPFNGTGTSGIACMKLNRKYIGIELNEEYCEITAKRCEETITGLTIAEQEAGQLLLFDDRKKDDV